MNLSGSCHCGRVAFDLDAEIAEVYDCNCSMCRRRGGLLAFVPREALTLRTPEEAAGTYRFNKHHIAHRFCPDCGIAPYSEAADPRTGAPTAAVNVRCLEGVDLAALKVVQIDGASL
ncbi:GFA family protein [Luteimonas sp. RD2P54]|uniref:GFA family protein n=1 Tax=Luteimonas endophytica TaxID=3042023 RepID=A0ABT6JC77_9GAMM|nr:GFA family protein [Luteimonas endophytica]MDH5824431.1 GFA family protein [Luteimonas endophytica]